MVRSAQSTGWRLAALLLAFLLMLPAPCARAAILGYGVVTNETYVNLRSQPSQSSTRLGSYSYGEWLEITGESGNWYSVNGPDGKSGWASKNYVHMEDEVIRSVGIVTNPRSTGYLNLRQSPSYSARVLDYYYNGIPCTLLGLNNGWYQVRVNGTVGYFRSEYLQQKSLVASDVVATVQTPNNSGLNLRAGPGKKYASLKQFRGGTYVMVLQKGNGWWKVSVDGYVGFMSTDYLQEGIVKPDFSTGSSSEGTKNGYGIVTNPKSTQVLNLRESASTSSRILSWHRNGTRVEILEQGTEWCHVRVNSTGKEGYMMTQYLTLYNLSSTPTMTIKHPKGSYVNLRSSPSFSGTVLTRMPHNAVVTVIVPGESWVKVRYNGTTGYAVRYFME